MTDTAKAPARIAPQSSRWPGIALAVIATCQLIVVLDSTVIYIALDPDPFLRALLDGRPVLGHRQGPGHLLGGAEAGSLGLILGRVLVSAVPWRRVLFINVPIGMAVVVLAPRLITCQWRPERLGPFSPGFLRVLDPALPPGVAVDALRSTVYFHGHDVTGQLLILAIWTAVGVVALVLIVSPTAPTHTLRLPWPGCRRPRIRPADRMATDGVPRNGVQPAADRGMCQPAPTLRFVNK